MNLLFILPMKKIFHIWSFLLLISNAYSNEIKANFNNLDSMLSDHVKSEIRNYQNYLVSSQTNDLSSQLQLAFEINVMQDERKIGAELIYAIYQDHGFDIKDEELKFRAQQQYIDLATEILRSDNIKLSPILGYRILLEAAKSGQKYPANSLVHFFSYLNVLPNNELLSELWSPDNLMKDKRTIEALITPEMEDEPSDDLFTSCKNPLANYKNIIAQYHKIQQSILSETIPVGEKYKFFEDVEIANFSDIVTFRFNDIEVKNLIALMVSIFDMNNDESLEHKIKYSEKLKNKRLDVYITNVPLYLNYAKLLDKFEIAVKCHNEWLFFDTKIVDDKPTRDLFLTNFMVKFKQDKTSKMTTIEWDNGTKFQGIFQDGFPQGKGEYLFHENGQLIRSISGDFNKGRLRGFGKDIGTGDSVTYTGEYKNGLYHGKGHVKDGFRQIDNKGQFINGEYKFTGIGEHYMIREQYAPVRANKADLTNYILFKGPLVDSKPHGKGHCYLTELDYACTFYHGIVIAVEDFSLLPDNIVIPE